MQEIHFISVSVLKHIKSAIQSNFTQTTIFVWRRFTGFPRFDWLIFIEWNYKLQNNADGYIAKISNFFMKNQYCHNQLQSESNFLSYFSHLKNIYTCLMQFYMYDIFSFQFNNFGTPPPLQKKMKSGKGMEI